MISIETAFVFVSLFSLWQHYFPYLQAIIRSCIKSVWGELIWAPFICFVSFVHTNTHIHAQTKGSGFFSRTHWCCWQAHTRGAAGRPSEEVAECIRAKVCVCKKITETVYKTNGKLLLLYRDGAHIKWVVPHCAGNRKHLDAERKVHNVPLNHMYTHILTKPLNHDES